MILSDEQIEKFQALYKARFGKEISVAEATEKGIKLIMLMRRIYQPITPEEYAKWH